jgi:heme-binding NEAT domain protein
MNMGKIPTTVKIPAELKKQGKKYMVDLGMNFSAWVCDRLHREMEEYYKNK